MPAIAGKGVRSLDKTVMLADGSIATCETDRQKRWQDHFVTVFAGRLVPYSKLVDDNNSLLHAPVYLSDQAADGLLYSLKHTANSYSRLPFDKGVGPDDTAGDLLRA